ncbi:MAG: prepilin-type N-terminal cleavage/methylation domain-containing protein [Actinomycetota bacterium]|nr:prepilin-type N-terminal cleavage/methylation domain-containing protein [Actinomycetota bacterium]
MEPLDGAQRGFSLVELMVVVLIIAVLIAIAIPTFLGARQRAQDRAAQQMLVNGLKVEKIWKAENGWYTADSAVLESEEPALDWNGSGDDAVHVAVSGAAQVLLYARSTSGTWFGIRLAGGRQFTCQGQSAAEVDEMSDCTGNDQW